MSISPEERPQKPPKTNADAESVLEAVTGTLEDGKAIDTVVIELAGKTSIADFMVVSSGRSPRHVGALAEQVTTRLRQLIPTRPRVEGLGQADWVLLDCGDVIVHIFRPEVRSFYNLEKMWSVDLSEAETASHA